MQTAKAGRDDAAGDKKFEIRPLGHLSLGLATMFMASGAAAQSTLPPVDVEAKKSAPRAKAKAKSAPAPKQQAAPVIAADEPAEYAGPPINQPNALNAGTGLGRLPGSLQDTPQTVNEVSARTLQEQKVNTLDQALRNVPGVTVALGEGGAGLNGDQFRIRGFEAKGDVYVDGLRDFGVYTRDSFAYESVQVFKGPSSESFGMGTTGGAINAGLKKAHLGDAANVEGTIGMGPMYRTTVDINKQINSTTAVRVVGMWHNQEFVDRDHLYSDRWGALAAVGFGLGTNETLHLSYMFQRGDRLPDYGTPMIGRPKAVVPPGQPMYEIGTPVTEQGVDRSNFYGKATDMDKTDTHLLTSRYQKTVSPGFTVYNDSRVAFYSRDFAASIANCGDPNNAASQQCVTDFYAGNPTTVPFGGGNPGYLQEAYGAQNITTAVAKANIGGLRHEFVAGIDVSVQYDERVNVASAGKQPQDMHNPTFHTGTGTLTVQPHNRKEANSSNIAFFASDRVWFNPEWSVLGGVRVDRYEAHYKAKTVAGPWTTDNDTVSTSVSPKASLIWEPNKQQTYYLSWARSFTPHGAFISNENTPVGGNNNYEPEQNDLWELGGKWSFLNDRLGFTAALFRVDKGNASYDDNLGNTVITGEKQRVQGIELGVSGQVTRQWTVQAAYTYMDSEIRSSGQGHLVGLPVDYVPEHNVSIWSTYDIAPELSIPGSLLVGGGIRYNSEYMTYRRNRNPAPLYEMPASFTVDGLVSYEIQDWKFALNGYNLLDDLNYDGAMTNRALVAPGRTILFTVGKKF